MEHDVWQAVIGAIEPSVSHAAFVTFFKNSDLVSIENGIASVTVPNIIAKAQFEAKFNPQVMEALRKNHPEISRVDYIIQGSTPKKTTPSPAPLEEKPAHPPTEMRPSVRFTKTKTTQQTDGLNPRYTFDDFIVGSSNDLAYAACQAVAKMPGTKYNPLFLYGGVGLGKTHLIQAVGNEIKKADADKRVLYVTSETFINEFLDSIRFKKKDYADKYRKVDVLIVDDVQFIAGKQATQEGFFNTFNALHQANKQIVLSSDKPPKSMQTLTDRLRSRFEWGMTIDIQMPDFETRCAILETKASLSGVELSRETTEYLAKNIKTNIRELEGALNQLLAFAEVRGIKPDIETAEGLLGNVRASRPHHLSPKQIIEKTSKYYRLETSEVMGAKRDKHIVVPRQIAMYLLRSELHLSFPRIATELGRKDHTTAIHSVEKIEKAIKLDFLIREQIADIREKLYG